MDKIAEQNEVSNILWGIPYKALKKDDQFTVNHILALIEQEQKQSRMAGYADGVGIGKALQSVEDEKKIKAMVEALQQIMREVEHEMTPCTNRVYRIAFKVLKPIDAVLKGEEKSPKKYGCHCDLDSGQEPDGCVLDDDRPQDCDNALRLQREGKDKTSCKYWKEVHSND